MNKVEKITKYLDQLYPNAYCELNYTKDYELLLAVMLSAQTTDKRVNQVTKVLFQKYPSLPALKEADIKDLEQILKEIGTYHKKAAFVKEIATILTDQYQAKLPTKRKELEKLVEKLNLSNQVEFKGLVSQQVLIHSYQTAKIAILPSYDKEGIMSTLLEAAGCGTPAITTRGTSMEEFAKNDENALLVNSCDAEDLCKKIYLLIMNKNLYEKISKNALNEVKSKYSWINKAKELIHLYGEV